MATSDVRAELECSVCLHTFTDPVNLTCGHTFCRHCIDRVLDTQETSGDYSCPECREEFAMRPTLHKNIALRKILENIVSADQKETRVLCTYCVDSSVPAVKSCLLCEAHLCEKHLRVHSKSPEHVLCDPTTSLQNRKCSIHKRILEYYCTEDSACICVSCRIDEAHEGHHVDRLDVASENRKKKLRDVLERMMTMREDTEERVRSLIDHKRRSEEKAHGERERVIAMFSELRRRLKNLEKRVLRDITGQAERTWMKLNDVICELEIKKNELSKKMHHVEELCNVADPLTILKESDSAHLCNMVYKQQRCDIELQGDLDFVGVSHAIHKELSTIIKEVAKMMPASTPSAMSSSLPLEEARGSQDDHTGFTGASQRAMEESEEEEEFIEEEEYEDSDEEEYEDSDEGEHDGADEEEPEDVDQEEPEDADEEESEDADEEESEDVDQEESEDADEEESEDADEEESEDADEEEPEGAEEEEWKEAEQEESEEVEEEESEDTDKEGPEGAEEEEWEEAEEEESEEVEEEEESEDAEEEESEDAEEEESEGSGEEEDDSHSSE